MSSGATSGELPRLRSEYEADLPAAVLRFFPDASVAGFANRFLSCRLFVFGLIANENTMDHTLLVQ